MLYSPSRVTPYICFNSQEKFSNKILTFLSSVYCPQLTFCSCLYQDTDTVLVITTGIKLHIVNSVNFSDLIFFGFSVVFNIVAYFPVPETLF